ncbi:NAD(P)-binding protein [Mycena capillaripes]|nr:NAD(P)-binding protein [Mycena capillaripes]
MGNISSYLAQSFPPKAKFSVEDIPDLTGRVIIVTGEPSLHLLVLLFRLHRSGGNGGIGYEIVKALLPKNAKVYMLSRSKERAESAISRLKTETGKEAMFIQLDLADLDSVRRAADEFKSKENQLDVLFNNGGVMNTPIEQLTKQGFDLQFGTNVLGHYLLTKRLLPLLNAAAQSSPDKKARIVHLSSSAQMFVDTVDLDALTDGPARNKLGPAKLYMQSKFANIVLSNELARRYGDKGIVSTSANPGNLKTDLQRHTPGAFMMLFGWMFSPAPYGALTPLYAGVSAASVDLNGKYLIPWARVGAMRKEAADPNLGEKLWNWLEEQTKE